jgi:hypothetical protein
MTAALMLSGCEGESGYIVSGSISGLSANGLVLRNSGGEELTVPMAAPSFQFPTRLPLNESYDVTVAAQPAGLTCTVSHGSGANVQALMNNNVTISCSARTYTLAGTISGLTTGGLVLQNNGTDLLAVAAHATTFQFLTPIAAGSGYKVVPSAQPAGLSCTVSGGVGGKISANVESIRVTCSPTAVVLGGTIAGLNAAGLVLQDNGADDLTIAANATTFQFPTPLALGSGYSVTVLAHPAGETCSIAGGSSTATADVTDIVVSCVAIPTFTLAASSGANGTITPTGVIKVNSGGSVSFVATPSPSYGIYQWMLDGAVVQSGGDVYTLSNVIANHSVRVTFAQKTLSLSVGALTLTINDTTLNAALTGTARQVIISNTGSMPATNVSISYPTWPAGTTAASTCGSTLAPAASCSITVTPGGNATSACTSGIAPTPGVVSITSSDLDSSLVAVTVVGYGCIYQGGYVFSIDDTTANTGSISGKVSALTDQAAAYPNGVEWSPDGDGFNILGIDENSTSPCVGNTDGACNTAQIVAHYSTAPPPSYAAGLCLNTIDGYSDWYLPAICELGPDDDSNGSGCGTFSSPLIQNMETNWLGASGNLGSFWSSTESSGYPVSAWQQYFNGGATDQQYPTYKSSQTGVRCARALTN